MLWDDVCQFVKKQQSQLMRARNNTASDDKRCAACNTRLLHATGRKSVPVTDMVTR